MLRLLEEEIMDDVVQVAAYAEANFDEQDSRFVDIFCQAFPNGGQVLDLGCGPAKIPARICQRRSDLMITGIDASPRMIERGQAYSEELGIADRLSLIQAYIPCAGLNTTYDAIISNSLLHHLPQPSNLWDAVKKHAKSGTLIMIVDLHRPRSLEEVEQIVAAKAGKEPDVLRRDFFNSLCAAFTVTEVNAQLEAAGLPFKCRMLSDIHWIVLGTCS